jgi:SAM-dependent methyltransferase
MLAQARKNLAGLNLHVPLHQVDYRELPRHFATQFDAVMCLSSSIWHMPDESEVLRAFDSMRAVMRRGGILVLTQGTTDRQWQEKPRFVLAVNNRTFTRLIVIDYLGPGARYNIVDIDHTDEAQGLRVWSVDYPRAYLRDDYERLLAAAGFEGVDFYGSYRSKPYDRQRSKHLIVVAHR